MISSTAYGNIGVVVNFEDVPAGNVPTHEVDGILHGLAILPIGPNPPAPWGAGNLLAADRNYPGGVDGGTIITATPSLTLRGTMAGRVVESNGQRSLIFWFGSYAPPIFNLSGQLIPNRLED